MEISLQKYEQGGPLFKVTPYNIKVVMNHFNIIILNDTLCSNAAEA